MNIKSEISYEIIFNSIINFITQFRIYDLDINTIVTDGETAIVKSVKIIFPNARRISCLFHYKQDIMRNIRTYGLYKSNNKQLSDIIINKLSIIPIIYKGDIKIVNKELDNIINNYPIYINFINNYFKINKLPFFIDKSLNYSDIPLDCRTNNYI